MKRICRLVWGLMFIAGVSACSHTSETTDDAVSLARETTPPVLNDSIDRLLAKAEADSIELHSMMVLQHGKVIYEKWMNGGNPDSLHILNSVSKTFTSLAIGLAMEEGKLKLDDKLVSFFPDQLPQKVSDNLAAITVRHLLTMTCGHATDHTYEMQQLAKADPAMDWVKQFLSYPVEYTPGEVYCYNSVGTFMLSAILQKVTGEKLFDYLNKRLFEPLGIKHACWTETKQGINYGGWGLYLKTEDLVKVGQLLLQKGEWNGKRLIPAAWVQEMSKKQVDSSPAGINSVELSKSGKKASADPDWIQGYGYQMWRCRNNAFRADGARGQYILVLPDQDAVIAMTANTLNMQGEINLVWRYVLPVLNNLTHQNQ